MKVYTPRLKKEKLTDKEYSFLMFSGFRSEHFKAKTLKQAWKMAKKWFSELPEDKQREHKKLLPHYIVSVNDYLMSDWRYSSALE